MLGEALEVERRLGQHAVGALPLDDRADRVGEAGVGARRDEVERVAQMAPDRALGHVRADEAHLALAVLAQAAEQRRGAGGARGGDDDGDRFQSHDSSWPVRHPRDVLQDRGAAASVPHFAPTWAALDCQSRLASVAPAAADVRVEQPWADAATNRLPMRTPR